ncbi:unnamed protein product [Lactuca saligna]|uniref:ATP-dependent DNA helicase n=1 Tax=Lactuca saligna TaxID=75948 RepID=A0AA36EC29_LACSI|nr:unnamed protein product [Lactuca saligna]
MSYDKEALQREHDNMLPMLNSEQLSVYNSVISSIENNEQILVFVYGHGGTGKTFLWRTIISHIRSKGKIVLAVAASGIASLLLPSGKTAHSRFKIPIDLTDKKSCDIKKRTSLADLLQRTSLIIWDEAPMSDRRCFEFLDRSLRDVLDCNEKLFGGISVLLGGDFRQTLPVLPRSTRSEIIALTLPCSYLWGSFTVHILHTNMRVNSSERPTSCSTSTSAFTGWLLRIGNGQMGMPDNDDPRDTSWLEIPDSFLIKPGNDSLNSLINFVYGDGVLNNPTAVDLSARAIVTPTNDVADNINTTVLGMVSSEEGTYKSIDIIQPIGKRTSDFEGLYPTEYLNQLNFPGIPPHELTLKLHCPIMLLRNINQREGLCNGTRLIVSQLLTNIIEATIMTGTFIGKRVYIPRIKFIHKSTDMPFTFSRKQFPLKVCYVMTINKSQGQSLRRIGVYLAQPVFSHAYPTCISEHDTHFDMFIRHTKYSRPMSSISELKTDGIGGPLQVRIVRKWRHDVRRYETWYLAVDRFGDAIQILGQRTNQSYIESILNLSHCYTISDYSCPMLDKYQKFLQNDFYIDVGLMSVIEQIPDTLTIPKNWFHFLSKRQLIDLGDTPSYYLDYIGVLSKIRDCVKVGGESYVLLILTDESGSELAINLWKECITNPQKFNRNSLQPPPTTTVVAVTNLKPSISNGALRHGSSHATHVYVNPDIPETTSLINLYTGALRPMPPLAGTPSTLGDMRKKTRSELLDKTLLVCASIKDILFQNSWYQTTCTICKDPIFRRGENWFCSAHGHIDKPNYIYKLSVIITDATDSIQAAMSETSCRKLLGSNLDKFISENPMTNPNVLPINITNERGNTKTMSIQMIRASTSENIRFIIIDHDPQTRMSDTSIPTTPTPTKTTRVRQNNTSPGSSTNNQNVARPLTYDLVGATPKDSDNQIKK